MKLFLADEAATEALGASLYEALPDEIDGWTVLLSGELGAGKSTLARAFIRSAGHEGAIPSPTYTLVEPYSVAGGKIYHMDLYRIADPEELRYLGWSELEDGFRLVEWPQRAPELAATADLAIELGYDGAARVASIDATTPRGAALIQNIK